MKNNKWFDVIGGLDEDLIQNYFELDEEYSAEYKRRKRRQLFSLAPLAASILLFAVMLPQLLKPAEPQPTPETDPPKREMYPVSVIYDTVAEADKALGFSTLLSNPSLGIGGVSILYETDESGNPQLDKPLQMAGGAALSIEDKDLNYQIIVVNVLFECDGKEYAEIHGYCGEIKTENINGIRVEYALSNNSYSNTMAVFTYSGNLYVIETTQQNEETRFENYISAVLESIHDTRNT